jgi:hypothetical protein
MKVVETAREDPHWFQGTFMANVINIYGAEIFSGKAL